MQKLEGRTFNVVQDNIEKLKGLFPEVFTENKIDIDKLRLALGDNVEKDKERYEFTWNGKTQSIELAQKQTTGTLLPCKKESLNWETTQNLYLEGDNLEVLRVLQSAYRNKIQIIYIDPPYNTGKDFVYKDDFHDNLNNYKIKSNENMKSNPETNGRYHTDWLNMMYPRLKIAKSLLKEEGFIAVSISDEELHNLRKLLDEIFGENNFRNDILVRRYDKNINNQFVDKGLKSLNVGSEHILIYSNSESASLNAVFRKSNEERSANGYWKGFWNDADRPTMRYDILGFTPTSGQWKWRKELAEQAVQNYIEYLNNFADKYTLEEYWENTGKKLKFIRRRKHLTGKNMGVEHWVAPSEGILRSSNWNDLLVSESISNLEIPFDSPKSTEVIKELLKMLSDDNATVLDFFSGSSSTAHAVLKLNAEEQATRKFIMVQLQELTDEKSNAYKAGYKNICEIGKDRIRKAGEKIKTQHALTDELDTGFKVFKLDETNLKIWDEESLNLEKDLLDLIDPVKENRTQEDVVYEILLKYGIELTVPIEEKVIAGKSVHLVGMGYLLICLEQNLELNEIEEFAKLSPARIVFYDEGFKDDTVRTNAQQILKRYGVHDIRVI
ncbi:site-specific DNA-methyltransferase [Chryseomicrobium excrementi]|uniref:Site-specific DNA-methyltransferase n=1 Tax=Chryseomicrobium excrementi TaxID=2041346 RepID=A0A2M9F157_9BACL|nr:site-specific DNA-methyltransferase [Chryseomicrobium excrementi]PJK17193.1 site-specific DNA-methyltransferase [Chryseomicrobium excrementi]